MGLFKAALLCITVSFASPVFAICLEKEQISYALKVEPIETAISLYLNYYHDQQEHDTEILTQLGTMLLKKGVQSPHLEDQLSSLYGAHLAKLISFSEIIESALHSQHEQTKLAALHFLAKLFDDKADLLLKKFTASSSPYLAMQSAAYLAEKKHPKAASYLQGIMQKFPPEFSFYFPPLFAQLSSQDAMNSLKKLLHSPYLDTRIHAMLSIANHHLDLFLQPLRSYTTHLDHQEQEASIVACALLKDSKSIPQMQMLTSSTSPSVRLAALYSLYLLGEMSHIKEIEKMALEGDLYAIALLAKLPSETTALYPLLHHSDIHVRFNTALSLLLKKEEKALPVLEEFLFDDLHNFGFLPLSSPGKTMTAWKVIYQASHQNLQMKEAVQEILVSLKEHLLTKALELNETVFLSFAAKLFNQRETRLIPLLVSLLENHKTEGAITLLKKYSSIPHPPLIRMWCNLALFRLKENGPYEVTLKEWILHTQHLGISPFRSLPATNQKILTPYELTPHENAALLLESYQAIAQRHTAEGIDLILQGIKNGHVHNRYILAGLLLHAIE